MAKGKNDKEPMVVVSFKISRDSFKLLERYADGQSDDSGNKLSPGLAAKRLVSEGLKRLKK